MLLATNLAHREAVYKRAGSIPSVRLIPEGAILYDGIVPCDLIIGSAQFRHGAAGIWPRDDLFITEARIDRGSSSKKASPFSRICSSGLLTMIAAIASGSPGN